MAEQFYNDFHTYPDYDSMGVGEETLKALYPDKENRDLIRQVVRGMFTSGHVSYEEAGDLLRMGENVEGNVADDGSLRSGTIWEGLRNVRETSVEVRQATRAALFAAAASGVES